MSAPQASRRGARVSLGSSSPDQISALPASARVPSRSLGALPWPGSVRLSAGGSGRCLSCKTNSADGGSRRRPLSTWPRNLGSRAQAAGLQIPPTIEPGRMGPPVHVTLFGQSPPRPRRIRPTGLQATYPIRGQVPGLVTDPHRQHRLQVTDRDTFQVPPPRHGRGDTAATAHRRRHPGRVERHPAP